MVINVYRVLCACRFTSVISFNLPSMPVIVINVIILDLQVRGLRFREGKQGDQGHTAHRWHMGLSHRPCWLFPTVLRDAWGVGWERRAAGWPMPPNVCMSAIVGGSAD